MNFNKKLSLSLLSLRLGVFVVMFMWTIDKFINPNHASKVFSYYYKIDGLSEALSYGLGSIQLFIVIGFLVGYKRKYTYGAILVMHLVSTLSSYAMYLDPWGPKNLLFFAAWPMLAAIFCLFLLREKDDLFTIKEKKNILFGTKR